MPFVGSVEIAEIENDLVNNADFLRQYLVDHYDGLMQRLITVYMFVMGHCQGDNSVPHTF